MAADTADTDDGNPGTPQPLLHFRTETPAIFCKTPHKELLPIITALLAFPLPIAGFQQFFIEETLNNPQKIIKAALIPLVL